MFPGCVSSVLCVWFVLLPNENLLSLTPYYITGLYDKPTFHD